MDRPAGAADQGLEPALLEIEAAEQGGEVAGDGLATLRGGLELEGHDHVGGLTEADVDVGERFGIHCGHHQRRHRHEGAHDGGHADACHGGQRPGVGPEASRQFRQHQGEEGEGEVGFAGQRQRE